MKAFLFAAALLAPIFLLSAFNFNPAAGFLFAFFAFVAVVAHSIYVSTVKGNR